MIRERALRVVLVIVGLLFIATVYGIAQVRWEETLQMMLSIYVTLGVFLLLALRNLSANRSLIAFTAWSSLAHASVMSVQSFYNGGERRHLLLGSLAFAVIGVALIMLAPAKIKA
jgi:glucan phosphoethanolaminetransferase (alkaline phosphatase superfamily)